MDSKKITMRDIAKEAGVSPATVFRVLSSSTSVSPATRAKVIAAQQILLKQPDRTPSNLRNKSSVGIIMPKSSASNLQAHPSILTIITAFIEELTHLGIDNTTIVYDEESISPEDFLAYSLDGYLVIGTSEDFERSIVPMFSNLDTPCVLINRQVNAPHIGIITIDEVDAVSKAVNYLISLGHTKIAYVGGNKNYQNSKRRLQGYQQALWENQIAVNNDYIFWGEYTEHSGYLKAQELFSLSDLPTACFFASDSLAIGCIRYCAEHGISIPDNLSIVGFGNIDACQYISPSLTTIAQLSKETGVLAAEVLSQMIGRPAICNQIITLTTELIIRDSTAPLK